MNDDDTEERIGILAEANKIGQLAAEKLHAEQNKANPFAGLEARAKQRRRDNKMRKHENNIDLKSRSAGE
jgi:hypothetical protein